MAKYHLTNKAVEDLSDIWIYTTETWSEQQADYYYNMLILCCQKISSKPLIGLRYERIAPELFGYRANRHIIFYRVLPNRDILIIRILHQRMDIKHRILETFNR